MLAPSVFRWNPIRIILNNVRWALMDNKFKGEAASMPDSSPPPGTTKCIGYLTGKYDLVIPQVSVH